MRLHPEQAEIPLHGALRDAGCCCCTTDRPMRPTGRAALQNSTQQACDRLVIVTTWAARALLTIQANEALCEKAVAPQANTRNRYAELASDLCVRTARRRGQYDTGAAHQSMRRRPGTHAFRKALALRFSKHNLAVARAGHLFLPTAIAESSMIR